MYSNVILVLCCDRTAKAGLSLGESYGGVSTYHGCVAKFSQNHFRCVLCQSKQPCLVPTRAGLFQSFLSLELGSQQ